MELTPELVGGLDTLLRKDNNLGGSDHKTHRRLVRFCDNNNKEIIRWCNYKLEENHPTIIVKDRTQRQVNSILQRPKIYKTRNVIYDEYLYPTPFVFV